MISRGCHFPYFFQRTFFTNMFVPISFYGYLFTDTFLQIYCHRYFSKNSFSPNKPDWTDDPRNGNNKRPRAAGAWSSDGHKGHGGAPQAKRRKPPSPGSGKSVTEQMRRNVQAKVNAAKSARKKSGAISKKKGGNRARKKK